jgi:hypothetical protein
MYSGGVLYFRMCEFVLYRILRYAERSCMLAVWDILHQVPYPGAGAILRAYHSFPESLQI